MANLDRTVKNGFYTIFQEIESEMQSEMERDLINLFSSNAALHQVSNAKILSPDNDLNYFKNSIAAITKKILNKHAFKVFLTLSASKDILIRAYRDKPEA